MRTASHMTSGTDRRAAHSLSGEGLTFSLSKEIQEVRQDLARSSGQRTAKTLAKCGGMRVTLVYLEANQTIAPEGSAGGATVQVLEGRLRMHVDGSIHELNAGELMVMEQNLHEPIQAADRSAFLLTVYWPEGAGAWSQEQAQGRH
jgi:quercetin dioxygenase-like cupin family protein